MKHEAYTAALEFSKGAIDNGDVDRMKYWLGICADLYQLDFDRLNDDYRARAVELLVKDCK